MRGVMGWERRRGLGLGWVAWWGLGGVAGVGTVDPRGGDSRPQVKLLKRSQWLCLFWRFRGGDSRPHPTGVYRVVAAFDRIGRV